MEFHIVVLPGDGIGPEVVAQAVKVIRAVEQRSGHRFHLHEALIGGIAIDETGTALPAETLARCQRADAILLGAVGGPKWDDPTAPVRPEQGILGLRKALDLFSNLRPVKLFPALVDASTLKPSVIQGTDLVVVRELTGGLYFGKPSRIWQTTKGWRVVDTLRYTEQEITRVLRVGFELARQRRKKLASVDKANVLNSSRLWRRLANELAREYPDVQLEHVLVDACAMDLIRRPTRYDVIVTENMFGDILTDEASMLAGSMGMLPSASLGSRLLGDPAAGRRFGLYEPIHGSAPDIAGRDLANPIATILSAALMLRYSCGLAAEASAIERAVEAVLDAGYRTADLALAGTTSVGTARMGDLIAEAVASALVAV